MAPWRPGAVSLYAAIAGTGAVVHHATETVRPALLEDPAAELLRQPVGTPVVVSDRTTYLFDDSAVVFDRATILGTAMEIRTDRVATGLSLRWSRQKH